MRRSTHGPYRGMHRSVKEVPMKIHMHSAMRCLAGVTALLGGALLGFVNCSPVYPPSEETEAAVARWCPPDTVSPDSCLALLFSPSQAWVFGSLTHNELVRNCLTP